MPGIRSCSSSDDNDCNGIQDNQETTCKCDPNETPRPCDPFKTEGRGICTIGNQSCIDNNDGTSAWDTECHGLVEPQEEICDNEYNDENCNGEENEGCIVGGPCVFSPDGTNIEILGMGNDAKIYRRTVTDDDTGGWLNTNLLTTGLDISAELDCTTNANGNHIVARGNNPVGALMYASGTGNNYNPVVRKLESDIFIGHPSIANTRFTGSVYRIVARENSLLTQIIQSDVVSQIDNDDLKTISSSVDIADAEYSGAGDKSYAGFVDSQTLVFKEYFNSSGGAGARDTIFIASPPGATYAYSPANCRKPIPFGSNSSNLVVVANGDL